MSTKIEAAKICQLSGCDMIIANGLYSNQYKNNDRTKFNICFKSFKLDARKKWIISSVSPKGELIIDEERRKL